ncbi:glycoside hydrolase family 3 N-terminal domain-containing protein [Hymenobacter jeollabukensis]|uniref:beta-N-acetylhexosaminidase n=1 Tax=Hymenobacter jeollabukensis TaxID=2025313 RepID=A0A5R8WRA8_9BACT|nr:glycoside hydrolase family 3 N-terminal domain-containing protein [Hymenobacter jeollabukensis]TLM93287.1 glycosyl hydrolase [Hymenobacter jeollabukensis]
MGKDIRIGLVLLIVAITGLIVSSSAPSKDGLRPATVAEQHWVDSVFNSLSPDHRLGQLFMVAAYSNKTQKHVNYTEFLVREYNIGGLMFLQGGPRRQAILTNRYQAAARTPLLVAMDAEWGLNMRLDSSMHFAKQMTLGAMDDPQLVYQMGREIALKLRTLGVQVSFSPVMDVNSNPNNPVIGNRSFGENKEQVTKFGLNYIRGLQDHGVVAVAKHFPGHGDTDIDSHIALPVINTDMARLTNVDLYPFQKSFEAGVMGVMVGHLYMPLFDTVRTQSATISRNLVTGLLKEKMDYRGLVFTDALNMKSVSNLYKPGELDALALLAGNDVLLFSEDVPMAIQKIKQLIADNKIAQEDIDYRVRKILRAKYWAGLNHLKPVDVPNLMANLNRPLSRVVQQGIYEHATTVVRNEDDLLPFAHLDTLKLASITIGAPNDNEFAGTMQRYMPCSTYAVTNRYAPDSTFTRLLTKLDGYNTVVVSLHNMNNTPAHNYGIGDGALKFIKQLQANTRLKTVVVVMGNAYALKYVEDARTLVCGYEDNYASQAVVPQVLFGALPAKGRLPITVSEKMVAGTGLPTPDFRRLRYATPEAVGMDSKVLAQIDNIATEAIAYAATPGCQVLVAKDGAVIFDKSYGYATYDKSQPITDETIYDLASVSKVAGTLQAIMWLKDEGKINLDSKVSDYLTDLKTTNKKDMTVRDVLLHQAGLKAGIPTWERTVTRTGGLKPTFYASTQTDDFQREVIPGTYVARTAEDSVWTWIKRSSLLPKTKSGYPTEYSDLSFIILKRLAEKTLNQPLEAFLQQNFYAPLGLNTMTYNPLQRFPKSCIAPTENDTYFRHAQLQGTVHDQAAALMGGIAGHAGLFSNANDLAVLMQMNLQNGRYGGRRFFTTPVVAEFARQQSATNRRGLGWDHGDPSKPEGPTSNLSPAATFGHTGFTGTCVWMDPDNKILYVFLSNRVYPDAGNNKLRQYNIRTRIHDVIYKAIQTDAQAKNQE